jgi:hypothetical protein
MEDILTRLRELGLRLPHGLSDEQLTNYLKVLCPWSMTTAATDDGCYATTKRKQFTGEENASTSYGQTPAEAAAKLLLKQLEAGAYPVYTTQYKADAMAHRAVNP